MTAISQRYYAPASAASSASAASWSASARTARPSRWSCRSARCGSTASRFFTGFVRDLTERQQTETRLQELQTELVHVSRLTAMGEMASALAHELNQPLSAIANYLQGHAACCSAQRRSRRSTGSRDAVERAADQALRAGEIIRRLRDFVARGETERRVESLSKLIEEASALALVGAKEHGVRVRFELRSAASTWCWPTRCRSSRSCST